MEGRFLTNTVRVQERRDRVKFRQGYHELPDELLLCSISLTFQLWPELIKWIFVFFGEWTVISSVIIIMVNIILADAQPNNQRLHTFIPVFIWSLSQRVAGFLAFYFEVGEFEKRWNGFELTRLKLSKSGLQEKPVSISNVKVGDLVYLRGDSISPADILVLDTSNTRHADKIFHVSERKVTGDNKTSTKFAIRNFNSHNVTQNNSTNNLASPILASGRNTPLMSPSPATTNSMLRESGGPEAKDKIIKKLVGHIEYDSPSPDAEFGGSFKIKNDPKVSRITKDNILFCGTKLYTNW